MLLAITLLRYSQKKLATPRTKEENIIQCIKAED